MTQKEYNLLVQKVKEYYASLEEFDSDSRESIEYVVSLLSDIVDEEDELLNSSDDIEDYFLTLEEQLDWYEGDYRETMYPDVDEDDEEYNNAEKSEEYYIRKHVLNELKAHCLE